MEVVTIRFTLDAANYIRMVSECFELHGPFCDYFSNYNPIILPDFPRDIEQRFAMKIALHAKQQPDFNYIIDTNNVISAALDVIKHVLGSYLKLIPPEDTIPHMLNGYPINLLSTVCKTTHKNAHIIGESMKKFIHMRKTYTNWMPVELQMSTLCNNIDFDDTELQALYYYLGSRRRVYVDILTNCLLELRDHEKYLNFDNITIEQIITISKSSWMTLFLLVD